MRSARLLQRGGVYLAALALLAASSSLSFAQQEQRQPNRHDPIPVETKQQAEARHRRVAERRAQTMLICHRGALEFAHENTLEAYRAAFLLGADGNEVDVRVTKDGVLVCFHDDMLDHLLEAYGDVADYTWSELRAFRFRRPGRFGRHCRIPTLAEVLALHRRFAGLLHLDVKRPGLTAAIGEQLDRWDMWDHVVHAPASFSDARLRRGSYKESLYLDRSDVDAKAIAAMLQALRERVRRRSLHRHWRFHGLDGAAALRALFVLRPSETVELARYCLWRDDPAVEPARNPQLKNPRSWTDWRTKLIIFPLLSEVPGDASVSVCRDYLALSDEQARSIGPLQFEHAARALLKLRPQEATVVALLRHRRREVRGRAILFCLSLSDDHPWARSALTAHAPHALAYALP